MKKNLIIVVLSLLLCLLLFHDLRRRTDGISSAASTVALPKVEALHPEIAPRLSGATANSVAADVKRAPNQPISQHMLAMTRQEIEKSIPLLYSRYFAKANLSKAKTDLLLELLADRWMVGLEPDVQGAGENPLKNTKNDKLLEDLVGHDGLIELESSRASYLADQEAQDAIDAMLGGEKLNEDQNAAVSKVLKGYKPDEGFGDLLAAKTQITSAVESSLRSEYGTREANIITSLGATLGAADLAKFKTWSDSEFEKQLAFLKMMQAQKGSTSS